jgi:hypothetical protein
VLNWVGMGADVVASPVPRLATEWGELVRAHDDRNVSQSPHDEPPDVDVHSL